MDFGFTAYTEQAINMSELKEFQDHCPISMLHSEYSCKSVDVHVKMEKEYGMSSRCTRSSKSRKTTSPWRSLPSPTETPV